MFSFKNVEESKGFESKFIEPGIHVVTVKEVKGVSEGTPHIQFTFEKEGKTADIRFYMTDAASVKSMQKLKHLANKMIKNADLESITGDIVDVGFGLNKKLAGKKVRVKLCGEEVEGKIGDDGKKKSNWFKSVIGLPEFAEAVIEGAEYSPVPEGMSKLKFDPNNKFDMKRLETPTSKEELEAGLIPNPNGIDKSKVF